MFECWKNRKEPPPPERSFVPRVRKYSAPVIRYRELRPDPAPEGRVQIERAPGEPDRGSEQYRLKMLCEGIRKLSRYEEAYDPGGW